MIRVQAENFKNTHCFSNGRCFLARTANHMALFRSCDIFFSDHALKIEPLPIQVSNSGFTALVILIVMYIHCTCNDQFEVEVEIFNEINNPIRI